MQRKAASLTAGASGQAWSVHEGGVRNRSEAIHQPGQLAAQVARPKREAPLEHMQAGERLEVAVVRPVRAYVRPRRGGRVSVVDHGERALGARAAAEPQALEQPRMRGLRILAPDHDQPRAVANLAQRGGRGAAERHRGGAWPGVRQRPGGHQRPQAVGKGDRRARVFDGGVIEPAQQRTARAAEELGGSSKRRFDVRRLAVDGRGRCLRRRK